MIDEPIRVLIVDDSLVFVEAVKLFFATEPTIHIAGHTVSGETAVSLIQRLHPDVVLLDFNLGNIRGTELMQQISKLPDKPIVIMMGIESSESYRSAALQAGADEFLPKSDFGTHIMDIINRLVKR